MNKTTRYHQWMLREAAYMGWVQEIAEVLTVPDIDTNVFGGCLDLGEHVEFTALMLASMKGHDIVVALLLAVPDIDVNLTDRSGYTALMRAAGGGYDKVVALLLAEPDIDLNLDNDEEGGNTALMMAIDKGYDKVVALLLSAPGIDVNWENGWGHTALTLATKDHKIMSLVLSAPGIDVNFLDNDDDFRMTALMRASMNGCDKVVTLLLNMPNIEVNQSYDGYTALYWAAAYGREQVVALLLAVPGIDVNVENDNDEETPLMIAVIEDNYKAVALLLSAPSIDLNRMASDGSTALIYAVTFGRHKIVALLLSAPGIDINQTNNDGDTALSFALAESFSARAEDKARCESIVVMLLGSVGIVINPEFNPLHAFSEWGRIEFMEKARRFDRTVSHRRSLESEVVQGVYNMPTELLVECISMIL